MLRRPTGSCVAAFLRALTNCADTQEALARLRGAQIALFFEDLLVKVDAVGFVAAREAAAARPHVDARAVRLLRGYSSPAMTAAGALAIAAGAGSGALSRLTLRDVAPDGTEARIDGYPASSPVAPGRSSEPNTPNGNAPAQLLPTPSSRTARREATRRQTTACESSSPA